VTITAARGRKNTCQGAVFVEAVKKGNDDGKSTAVEDVRAEDTVFRAKNK
jgi:hypothetical protein